MKIGNATIEQHLAWAESELTPPKRLNPMSAEAVLYVVACFQQALQTLKTLEERNLLPEDAKAKFVPPLPELYAEEPKQVFAEPPAPIFYGSRRR